MQNQKIRINYSPSMPFHLPKNGRFDRLARRMNDYRRHHINCGHQFDEMMALQKRFHEIKAQKFVASNLSSGVNVEPHVSAATLDVTKNNLNGYESSHTGGKVPVKISQQQEPDLNFDDLAVVSDLFVCNEPDQFDTIIADLSDIRSTDFDFSGELTFQMKTTKYENHSGRKHHHQAM